MYQYVWYRIGKTASVNVRLKCFVQLQITLIVQRIIFLVEKSIDEKKSSDALDFYKVILEIRYIYNKLYAK